MRKAYWYISASLLISLFIYVFYRTEKTVVNELLISIISYKSFALLKASVVLMVPLSNLVIYSLPEGLWVFCITLTSKPFYLQFNHRRMSCVFVPLIYAIGLEFFQLLHLTNGRFDVVDIAVSLLFWSIGNFAFREQTSGQNILASLHPKTIWCVTTYCIVYLSHVVK